MSDSAALKTAYGVHSEAGRLRKVLVTCPLIRDPLEPVPGGWRP
jgi:hypothetical protein